MKNEEDIKPKEAKPKAKAAPKKDAVASDTPKDLRSKRNSGRPSNEERTSNEFLKSQLRLLAADLIADIRKGYKNYAGKDKASLLGMVLKTLSLNDDADRDEEDLTFELLAKKYLKLKDDAQKADEAFRIAATAQQSKQPETAADEERPS